MIRLTTLALGALLALSLTACENRGAKKPTAVVKENNAVESQDKGSVITTDEVKKVDDSNTGTTLDGNNTGTQQNTTTETQDNQNTVPAQGQ